MTATWQEPYIKYAAVTADFNKQGNTVRFQQPSNRSAQEFAMMRTMLKQEKMENLSERFKNYPLEVLSSKPLSKETHLYVDIRSDHLDICLADYESDPFDEKGFLFRTSIPFSVFPEDMLDRYGKFVLQVSNDSERSRLHGELAAKLIEVMETSGFKINYDDGARYVAEDIIALWFDEKFGDMIGGGPSPRLY